MIRLLFYFMLLVVMSFVNLVISTGARAETPEERGYAIAAEAERRDDGFGDSVAEMVMTLKNRNGQESVRRMRMRTLEVAGDGDKSMSVFDNPADVSGTAFLSFSHKVGDDDQWLYLPALKRVKRISSSNRSGSFMGSEFSYEDTASMELERYTYRYVGDSVYDGMDCFVNEMYPVSRNSGYTRLVAWVDKSEYRTQKIEYYDRKGAHLKTLTFGDYELFLGRYWRPHTLVMVNHQNGKSTTLEWKGYRFGNGLDDADFDRNALKRAW